MTSLKKKADEERKKMVAQHVSKTKSWIDSMISTPSESTHDTVNQHSEGDTKVSGDIKVHPTKVSGDTKVSPQGDTKVSGDTKEGDTKVSPDTFVSPSKSNQGDTKVSGDIKVSPHDFYDPILSDFIQHSGGFTSIGICLVLDWLLQENNGWVKIKGLANACGLQACGIRKHFRKLESLGIISILENGSNGSRIILTNKTKTCLERYKSIAFNEITNSFSKGDTKVSPSPRFVCMFYKNLKTYKPWERANFLTQLKEIFGLCLALGWSPMEQPKEILDLYGTIRQTHEAEWAIAFFLQYVPESRKNVVKYLQAVYAKDGAPDPKVASAEAAQRWNQADQILSAVVALPKKIGEEILPDEWLKAVRPLKIQADKKNMAQKQEALLIRLKEFLAEDGE